ncbi:M20 aminoacylase family protein [Pelagibacterium xiamenense]|uniref:M20 aminoacylase family protein n=1 Tax=Pelagibacterium xiamenense TaxID=2901140 RepID=UPI001E4FDD70|nr:M20 aminoacylase family protein [Pelagibacterium xiamenense]MCD7059176.1 M20 family metallopeptidase [Pelagibacterium xiamenense]
MPIINRVAEFQADIAAWRHDLHANPELLYDVHRTARTVAEKLKSFGVDEVVTGIGRTGVVGIIRGRTGESGRTIGLRADMDALPITERTGKPYASQNSGKMHACGHDGHTAMLLGAARYLAETRNFDGTVAVIFQPAEEGGAGGKAMIEDGLMERFGISEVFGMHNMPGIPLGRFAIREGGIMAATDEFIISVTGHGGHAAMPHLAVDPIVVSAHIVTGLQTLVSRNLDPIRSAVLSVTTVNAGTAHNIIPRTAKITGTVRTLDEAVRDQMEAGINRLVPQLAQAYGAEAAITYRRGYPVTVNAPDQTGFSAEVAREIAGADMVDPGVDPTMGGEDFAYMLQARPGSYIFLGNGASSELHTDTYDFNDEAIPYGVSYWVRLAERALPAG